MYAVTPQGASRYSGKPVNRIAPPRGLSTASPDLFSVICHSDKYDSPCKRKTWRNALPRRFKYLRNIMKILVASDGSKHAMRALKAAIELTKELRSKSSTITLINVHDDTGLKQVQGFVGKKGVDDYLKELSEKELKPSRKILDSSGVKHDIEICTGHVAKTIIDYAGKGKFDLLVLGSKGRGAIADLLLGSVAQRVMALTAQPVLLVK